MVTAPVLLETIGLVKRYGNRTVVDRVSYTVHQGEIVGLLGRNGAGKTTSFRITIGMIEPNGGNVIFNGEDVADLPMYKRAQRGIGYLSQEPSVFQRLTVRDNLLAILESMPLKRRDRKAPGQAVGARPVRRRATTPGNRPRLSHGAATHPARRTVQRGRSDRR